MGLAGTVLLVALGGALGGVLRWFVTSALDRPDRPWGTFFVNVTGSGAAGFGAAFLSAGEAGAVSLWALIGVGVLGSYTTVSAFTLQADGMARGGRQSLASGYVGLSVLFCLGAAAAGLALGRAVVG